MDQAARQLSVDLLVVGDSVAARSASEAARGLGATAHRALRERLRFEGRAAGRFVARAVDPARPDEPPLEIVAAAVVLASGTEPDFPPVTGLLDVRTFTTASLAEALRADGAPPESLLVLGGGPTGCAQAQAFATRGSRVTVIEAADRLLPAEEPVASAAVARALAAAGVRVLTGGTVTKVSPTLDGGVYAGTEVGGDVAATHLLLATGRRGAVAGLDLPALGLTVAASGFVGVDDTLATPVPGVYVAGDLTGLVEGEHADAVMGRIAATNAVRAARGAGRVLGVPLPRQTRASAAAHWQRHASPQVVDTEPAVVRIGLTLAAAEASPDWADVCAHDDDAGRGAAPGRILRLVTAVPARPGHRTGGYLAGRRHRAEGRVLVGATVVGTTAREDVAMAALAVRARVPVELLAGLALPAGTAARSAVELLAGLA